MRTDASKPEQKVMLFGFHSRTTEKDEIKITTDTFIDVSSDGTFLITNKKCTDQPKMTAKSIWKPKQEMKTFILRHTDSVERTPPACRIKGR